MGFFAGILGLGFNTGLRAGLGLEQVSVPVSPPTDTGSVRLGTSPLTLADATEFGRSVTKVLAESDLPEEVFVSLTCGCVCTSVPVVLTES